MKKKVFGRKLSRSRPAREALFASLIRSFILSGKIVTTKAKAKAILGKIEQTVSASKKGTIADIRRVLADLDNKRDAVNALTQKIAPAFSDRKSGFVRLINLSPRKGDNAEMVRIEWTKEINLKAETANKKSEAKEKSKPVEKEAKRTAKKNAKTGKTKKEAK